MQGRDREPASSRLSSFGGRPPTMRRPAAARGRSPARLPAKKKRRRPEGRRRPETSGPRTPLRPSGPTPARAPASSATSVTLRQGSCDTRRPESDCPGAYPGQPVLSVPPLVTAQHAPDHSNPCRRSQAILDDRAYRLGQARGATPTASPVTNRANASGAGSRSTSRGRPHWRPRSGRRAARRSRG